MQVERIEIKRLTGDPANARKHGERNIQTIVESLNRFGQQKPIVVDSSFCVRAGNGTLEAARSLGWTHLDCVVTDLKGSDAIAYAIADNRTAELAEWDSGVLAATLEGLQLDDEALLTAVGFSEDELKELLADVELSGDGTTGEIVEDEVPEPPVDPITKPGDLWILGRHQLLCGDSTKAEDVGRLLCGELINIAFTSPPYASQRKYDETSGFKPIPPDEYVEWYRDVAANIMSHLASDGSYFCNIKEHCEDGQRSLYVKDLTLAHVREWGWRFVDEFIWNKNGVPGSWPNRFRNDFEPIFHFSVSSQIRFTPEQVGVHSDEAMIAGERSVSNSTDAKFSRSRLTGPGIILSGNVLRIGCETAGVHTAPFPVALAEFFIKAFSDKGDTIFDPFMGSGTTLIAAEKNGRIGYGTEISPGYCDVIVKRWENLTGQKAVLDDTRDTNDVESNTAAVADQAGVSGRDNKATNSNRRKPKKQPA